MVCNNYSNLSPLEKVMFIGELTHACMCDDELYEIGYKIIELAKSKGMFENVKIMPDSINTDTDYDS
jgi:hypothetical protein